jgi:2'-5' RNA ligase
LRLFLAINLPVDVRLAISAAVAPLRELAPELAWVDESRLHLTLKFLGEQPPERVPDVSAALATVATRHRDLLMELSGVGAFPNFRRARVVWMGVAQDARLELLHHDVEVECERVGFEVEGRPFRPHLTLARVKHPLPEDRLRELGRAARRISYRSEFIVRSIDLMQSDLSTAGSSYTTLVSAALRSG